MGMVGYLMVYLTNNQALDGNGQALHKNGSL